MAETEEGRQSSTAQTKHLYYNIHTQFHIYTRTLSVYTHTHTLYTYGHTTAAHPQTPTTIHKHRAATQHTQERKGERVRERVPYLGS